MLPKMSRRRALRLLAGAPLVPLSGLALEGCAVQAAKSSPAPQSASFVGMRAPASAEAQATMSVDSAVSVGYAGGRQETFKLAYRPLFFTGDRVSDGNGGTIVAGGYFDIAGKPILDPSASTPTQFFSDCPDGYSLLQPMPAQVPGVSGNTVFAVVQFEYTSRDLRGAKMYAQLPSPIAVVTLDQDKASGALRVVRYHNVDTSGAHGLWITCGASLSPWNTHLGSEEYEPDAVTIAGNANFREFSRHLYGDADKASPYHYGHVPEVTVNPDGTGTLKKHYCLGRISHEVVQVMPDRRTVLMGDDATNGGLFVFVADRPADLSSGTLYVAKCTQQSGIALDQGGIFDLEWIRLGHATSDEIERMADTLRAGDILDVKTADPRDPAYKEIHYSGKPQWVRFAPGKEKAAAFLETHRWAAAVGATLAFTKMEGVTVNVRDRTAYLAMSYIYQSMSDGRSGIKVAPIRAGAVYQLPLAGGQKDTAGAPIDSDWMPLQLGVVPGLVGRDLAAADALGNLADAERIANPDNLKFSERLRTLFIGEDSGMHVNNFLWAYNVDTRELSRILSCPVGAESTGLQAVDDVNGFAYIMSNFQHPGDWEAPLHDRMKGALAPLIDRNYHQRRSAAVGYIEGLPVAEPS
jgi:secreted PhoX family phosphatase